MIRVNKAFGSGFAALLLVLFMAACAGGGDQPAATEGEPDSPGAVKDQGIVKVSAMVLSPGWQPKEWGADPVTKKITEVTGVEFEFTGTTGDPNEKANIMLISQDYPEVMWFGRGPALDKYLEAGALYALDELAEQYGYAKLFTEYIPDPISTNIKHKDGHIYVIPNWFSENGEFNIGAAFNLRTDIYEDMGAPKIETLEDLTNYFRKIRDENVVYQGLKVYPFAMEYTEGWIGNLANLWGSQIYNSLYLDGDKVQFFLRNDNVRQALRWLNLLYREKLIDPENFSYNRQQLDEAYAQGKYGVVFSDFWKMWTPEATLKLNDPRVSFKSIPAPVAVEGVQPYTQGYMTAGSQVAVVTKNAKNPQKIMEYFNFYMSPEGQILSFYGIEGETWDMVDGKPILRPEAYENLLKDWRGYSKKTGVRYLDLNQFQRYNWEDHRESPERQANRRVAEATKFDGTALGLIKVDATKEEGIVWANIKSTLLADLTKIILSADESQVDEAYYALLNQYEQMGLGKMEEAFTKDYLERKNIK